MSATASGSKESIDDRHLYEEAGAEELAHANGSVKSEKPNALPDHIKSHIQRVDSGSWEDLPSDDDKDPLKISMQALGSASSRRRTVSPVKRRSRLSAIDNEDQWEDESESETTSDSELSSTTDAVSSMSHARSHRSGDENTIRGTPQQGSAIRSGRLQRPSSTQKAGREYKKSRLALLQSQNNDSVDIYNRIVQSNGQGGNNDQSSAQARQMKRVDTLDRLDNMEPFTAGLGTEAVDEADGAGRAHEIRLAKNGEASASNAAAIYVDAKSPRPMQRRLSISPSLRASAQLSPAASGIIPPHSHPTNHDVKHALSEQYASVPASPIVEDADVSLAYLSASDGPGSQRRRTGANGIPRVKLEDETSVDPQTPRRHSKTNEAKLSAAASGSAKPKRELRPDSEPIVAQLDRLSEAAPPLTLWDYLKEEVMASDFDSTQEMKWERVTNFIAIPFWMEKIMFFGFFVCLDSFLYTFTILPVRFMVATYCAVSNFAHWVAGGQRRYMSSSHKCDILKALLITLSCFILSKITDASKMYHSVRGQDVVKLYVIFNVLEIADRLCCSFGQDLLDSLFSRSTLARRKDGHQPYLRPLGFFALSLLYVLAHTLVLLYQLVTLNVAINSYDNALLTLLLSNQFVEIKGSVFKKFEKENLFQLTCADIVERFQLTLMLCSIGMRNLIEVTSAAGNSVAAVKQAQDAQVSTLPQLADVPEAKPVKAATPLSAIAIFGPLPTSFTVFPSFSLLETIFTPVLIVLASEFVVDWLKHAFITKFNHIRPSVYGRFMDVLCRDLVFAGPVGRSSSRKRHSFADQSPVISRRLGFAAVPLACLLVRMTSQIVEMIHDDSHFDECSMPDLRSGPTTSPEGWLAYVVMAWRILQWPLILLLKPFVSNPRILLNRMWRFAWQASTWTLTVAVVWTFLVGVKLLLGTNLFSFASQRFATMAQREHEEELAARDRLPIGMDKDEMEYDAKVSKLIDHGEDDVIRLGLSGQPLTTNGMAKHKAPAVVVKQANGKVNGISSLMDVDRYTMIRSRIW